MDTTLPQRLQDRLRELYGPAGDECLADLLGVVERFRQRAGELPPQRSWDEQDVLLITYADQVRGEGRSPLATLGQFLDDEGLDRLLSTVHLLPFFPYCADDGFSVIDYYAVDPDVGTWDDVQQLRDRFRLMFDFVLNHISRRSEWFEAYRAGRPPFDRFFIEVDPETDLSAVVRPRSLPLLTPVETADGTRHLWTTFSSDQIDLNYAEPQVLAAMLDVLLTYVAEGAQMVRLDAVAYLWKEIGTRSIHLPQTHEVVRLLRDVLDAVAPHVWLLTETNVPHRENISYFGDGDEAQMVYQFSLPPLLLDAMIHGDATPLMQWLDNLEPSPPGTTFLNFTASHDGIGVRPLEGLVPEDRIASLAEAVRRRGGLVSMRHLSDGTESPYELNIAYVDAVAPDDTSDVELHARRFLATQAVMLAMQGIPAVYFHSLVGSQNDHAGAESSGMPRRINRHKFTLGELDQQIGETDSLAQRIYHGYRRLLEVRRSLPAFHPDAPQQAVRTSNPAIISFLRRSPDGTQTVLVVANVSDREQQLDLNSCHAGPLCHDQITGQKITDESGMLDLLPGQVFWLTE